MNRRGFLVLAALAPGAALAQARAVKVGVIGPGVERSSALYLPAFLSRLAELGFREGAGLALEYRSWENRPELLQKVVRELVQVNSDLVYIWGPEAPPRALREAGARMPVVFIAIDYDPVERGFIASLRRPGGNFTGAFVPQSVLVAKRLEIMREVLPAAQRFLVFADAFSAGQVGDLRREAQAKRVELKLIEFASQPYDFAAAVDAGRAARVDAFIGLASPIFAANRAAMAGLFTKHRLPAIGSFAPTAEAGFLMSYSATVAGVARQAADIAARILKGANPAEIPVEQANEFELIVNLKTARMLGLKFPHAVLARTTRVIE